MKKILLLFFIPYIVCSQSLSLNDLKDINSIEQFRRVLLENGYKEFNKKNLDQYKPRVPYSNVEGYYEDRIKIYFRPWNNKTYTYEDKELSQMAGRPVIGENTEVEHIFRFRRLNDLKLYYRAPFAIFKLALGAYLGAYTNESYFDFPNLLYYRSMGNSNYDKIVDQIKSECKFSTVRDVRYYYEPPVPTNNWVELELVLYNCQGDFQGLIGFYEDRDIGYIILNKD